ncbi:MAG: LLM class flavin-dependent oxidoreductase [Acidimicrobiales bacterium]
MPSSDGRIPAPVWDRVAAIREILYSTIADLSLAGWSFVFTNVIVEADAHGADTIAHLRALASARSTTYVPVVLSCDAAEHARRIVAPQRATLSQVDEPGRHHRLHGDRAAPRARRRPTPPARHHRPDPRRCGRKDRRTSAIQRSLRRRTDALPSRHSRPMRLGVSLSSSHFVDDHREGARRIIERARVARDAGLDSLSLGDHHATPFPYYQGVPMLGRLTAEWDPARPIGCLFLLPLWNPVLVAEQVGTLATLHPGPFVVQTGIGDGAGQFAAMNADLRTRGAALDESIRVVKALLAGEEVDSDRFGVRAARVSPRPPGPVEWWIGAGAPGPLARAAREGDAWYGGPDLTPATAAAPLAHYREAAATLGRPSRAIVRKDVIVLRDGNRARSLGDELVGKGYRGMPREALVYGGVDDVVGQLRPFEDLGFDDVIVRCMTIDQHDALETLELCGEVRAALAG